jgi:hypothetical protein
MHNQTGSNTVTTPEVISDISLFERMMVRFDLFGFVAAFVLVKF